MNLSQLFRGLIDSADDMLTKEVLTSKGELITRVCKQGDHIVLVTEQEYNPQPELFGEGGR